MTKQPQKRARTLWKQSQWYYFQFGKLSKLK